MFAGFGALDRIICAKDSDKGRGNDEVVAVLVVKEVKRR